MLNIKPSLWWRHAASNLLNSDFPLLPIILPSTLKDISTISPNLPQEKIFVDTLNVNDDNETLEICSLKKEITYVEGVPQVKWTDTGSDSEDSY